MVWTIITKTMCLLHVARTHISGMNIEMSQLNTFNGVLTVFRVSNLTPLKYAGIYVKST